MFLKRVSKQGDFITAIVFFLGIIGLLDRALLIIAATTDGLVES